MHTKSLTYRSGNKDCVHMRHVLYIQCLYRHSAGRPVLRYYCTVTKYVSVCIIYPAKWRRQQLTQIASILPNLLFWNPCMHICTLTVYIKQKCIDTMIYICVSERKKELDGNNISHTYSSNKLGHPKSIFFLCTRAVHNCKQIEYWKLDFGCSNLVALQILFPSHSHTK